MSVVQKGHVGIDFSYAELNIARIKKDGARFIIRYSAGSGHNIARVQGKLCRHGEIASAEAAGLDFIANSEWYETRVTEGASAGAADGLADLAFWDVRGLHPGAAIYVSWDKPPEHYLWPAVDAYLHAYRHALGGHYTLGAYAGTPYLRHALAAGIIEYGWQPNATAWSGNNLPYQPGNHGIGHLEQALEATPAAIWQTGNYWYSKDADENLMLRPACGSHLQAKHGRPHPGGTLQRAWPQYMAVGQYFGLISGPDQCHGGINAAERADVKALQQRLVALQQVPGVHDPNSGWCDGRFEQPTADAVTRWQKAQMSGTKVFGQVWPDDWVKLFTF